MREEGETWELHCLGEYKDRSASLVMVLSNGKIPWVLESQGLRNPSLLATKANQHLLGLKWKKTWSTEIRPREVKDTLAAFPICKQINLTMSLVTPQHSRVSQWNMRPQLKHCNFSAVLARIAKFFGCKSCTSENAIRRCNQKSCNPKCGVTTCDIPSFKHPNCCHTPKILRTTNFLPDSPRAYTQG